MNPFFLLPILYVTALLGQTDLGITGVAVTAIGAAGLALAVVAALRGPSRRLLWLLVPFAVPYLYFLVVGILLIGDHHETLAVSLYTVTFFASLALAIVGARRNIAAVAGATVFLLGWAFIAYQATLFVFWTNFH